MKKSLFIAAAVLAFAACEKKESTTTDTEVTTETEVDKVAVDADTLTPSEEVDAPEAEIKIEDGKEIKVEAPQSLKVDYATFGDKILAEKALTKEQMMQKYKGLKAGDTVAIKFKSKIKEVCSKKGCWMTLELPGGKESFVKFKDYAFFVPLNAADQEAIVSGKAFVSETSVAQLRHYAEDGGESAEAIAKITQPKVEYKFMADGVLISK
jgi:hypothetical protein